MKKIKLISAFLALIMAMSVFAAGTAVSADGGEWTPPLSIEDDIQKRYNKLPYSNFDDEEVLKHWNSNSQNLDYYTDDVGGYLVASSISVAYTGFNYSPVFEVEPATYKFTGYFRTDHEGEVSCLRIIFNQKDGSTAGQATVYITDQWEKVEFYVTLTDYLSDIRVCGGPYAEYVQDYCMDNFSLVKVDEMPEEPTYIFGTVNTPEQAYQSMINNKDIKPYDPEENAKYDDVKGIIINQDDSTIMWSFGVDLPTYEEIEEFARQYGNTHVTDFFIDMNAHMAVFPSQIWNSYLGKYHEMMEEGTFSNLDEWHQKALLGAHHVFETLDTDYVGIFHDVFKEVGINPWLSFRMNDVHNQSTQLQLEEREPTLFISDFFYEYPHLRRVTHHSFVSYFDGAADYAAPETRKYYLSLINEALNRYDTYGIKLDFQREIWLWSIGGEYEGIEILNQFMRDVDDLVAIYEEKYGHEIKIAVRVAPDPVTCEDFGLDPITWAVEGIIDMIIVGSRYDNNYSDIPVRLWCSIMHPYDVEVVMNIEYGNLRSYFGGQNGGHTIETFAALASQAYAQGADKIYLYNYYLGVGNRFGADEDKIVTDEPMFNLIHSMAGYWNAITSLGSPKKLLEFDRRHILTYNDILPVWKDYEDAAVLPAKVSANAREISYFRIPVGPVSDGTKLYLKFSTDDKTLAENPPVVYVNSELCTFKSFSRCDGTYTKNRVMVYEIPESVYGAMYMLAEIDSRVEFTIDFIEVYVDAPSWKK